MKHPLQKMIEKRKQGQICGIPSCCTANELVLEAILRRAKVCNQTVLIEATANQVNQYGGYTGMKPADFVNFIQKIAHKVGIDESLIILGGDHLGPLTWVKEPAQSAMQKSEELVRDYVKAGFTKIHLDTSMKLADDAKEEMLETTVIAKRGALLYKACLEAYEERKKEYPEALRPVFIIGSEVPIPGGAQEEEESIQVTSVKSFQETLSIYKQVFKEQGFSEELSDVIAIVVQPGVEFGDDQVFFYDREKAKELCNEREKFPNIVFEGHSTDYQTKECLKQMVEDGIAILKVGPALTFVLREALYALSFIEQALFADKEQAHFIETLEQVMLDNPQYWENHYHGTDSEKAFARKYSFSDRCRYYMGESRVVEASHKLIQNLSTVEIPMTIIHQFMPKQYEHILDGEIQAKPEELLQDAIWDLLLQYEYAANDN
jgi:Predicted tagatose 6-phosphate kinase